MTGAPTIDIAVDGSWCLRRLVVHHMVSVLSGFNWSRFDFVQFATSLMQSEIFTESASTAAGGHILCRPTRSQHVVVPPDKMDLILNDRPVTGDVTRQRLRLPRCTTAEYQKSLEAWTINQCHSTARCHHISGFDITGCAVAQHCYNGDVSFLWEKRKF